MPAGHGALLERITIDPDVRFGKPCIRGHRITVQEARLCRGVSRRGQGLQRIKLLFDESLAPRLIDLLRDYPTKVAAQVLRRNAIRNAEFSGAVSSPLILDP